MADKNRHTHTSRGHLNFWVEHFFRLDNHFPFFFGRAILHEHVNMRDDVESDLLGEIFTLQLIIDEDGARLREQLIHRRITGARHRLIGRNHHALDRRDIMQGLQGHHKLCRGAIRIGNNIALLVAVNIVRIDFRHNERHVVIHAI